MEKIFGDVDFKSIIIGAAITAACVIIGSWKGIYEYAYPFAAIGLIYVGYKAKTLKRGAFLGAFASTPTIILALQGYLGVIPDKSKWIMVIAILLVGALIGFVGAWAKRDRDKAKLEYEKKQKIGKNKNKKKNKQAETAAEEKSSGFLNKILKK